MRRRICIMVDQEWDTHKVCDYVSLLRSNGYMAYSPFCDNVNCDSPLCYLTVLEWIGVADEVHVLMSEKTKRVVDGIEFATMLGKKLVPF